MDSNKGAALSTTNLGMAQLHDQTPGRMQIFIIKAAQHLDHRVNCYFPLHRASDRLLTPILRPSPALSACRGGGLRGG